MKDTFVGLISWLDMAKERFSDVSDRSIQTATEMQRKTILKANNIQEIWDNFKGIIRLSEREERKNREEIFEVIMTDNSSKLMIGTKPEIQKNWRTPSRINTKKTYN